VRSENKGVAEKNHEEHERFLEGLGRFDEWIGEAQKGEREYDGGELRRLIERFARELEEHLRSEVEVLLGLERDEGVDWEVLGKTMARESKRVADRVGLSMFSNASFFCLISLSVCFIMTLRNIWLNLTMIQAREVPFLIVNADVTYEGGIHGPRFPPFPWFVGQIFRWWYVPQLKGAWRFASCDDYGMPKELPFA